MASVFVRTKNIPPDSDNQYCYLVKQENGKQKQKYIGPTKDIDLDNWDPESFDEEPPTDYEPGEGMASEEEGDKDLQEEFVEDFRDIVKNTDITANGGMPYDIHVKQLENPEKTSQGKLKSTEAIARVHLGASGLQGLSFNEEEYSKLSKKHQEYIVMHEALHLDIQKHSIKFFRQLENHLEEYYGDFSSYREYWSNDIRISGPSGKAFNEFKGVNGDEAKEFTNRFMENLDKINQVEGLFDELSFRGSMQMNQKGCYQIFLGRGQGREQALAATIDMNDETVEYSSGYDKYIDDSGEIHELSNEFREAFNQVKTGANVDPDEVNKTSEKDQGMNEDAVKKLTKQGAMVEIDAAEIITDEDVARITALETTPMYVSESMIKSLRSKGSLSQNPDYREVKVVSPIPSFMGTDLEEYEASEEGDIKSFPEDNAEILVNRGNAEYVDDKSSSSNSGSRSQSSMDDFDSDSKSPDVERLDDEELEYVKGVIDDMDDGKGADRQKVLDMPNITEDKLDKLSSWGETYQPSQGRVKTI